MKLLRHKKTRKGWTDVVQNGELGFDNFIGAGVIEILKPNTNPTILRLDLSKESITPKDTKKQPTIGVPGNPGMGAVMAGVCLWVCLTQQVLLQLQEMMKCRSN